MCCSVGPTLAVESFHSEHGSAFDRMEARLALKYITEADSGIVREGQRPNSAITRQWHKVR